MIWSVNIFIKVSVVNIFTTTVPIAIFCTVLKFSPNICYLHKALLYLHKQVILNWYKFLFQTNDDQKLAWENSSYWTSIRVSFGREFYEYYITTNIMLKVIYKYPTYKELQVGTSPSPALSKIIRYFLKDFFPLLYGRQ